MTITYTAKARRKTVTAKIAKGRWKATLKLSSRLRRATGRATVTVTYKGDADTRKASVKKSLR